MASRFSVQIGDISARRTVLMCRAVVMASFRHQQQETWLRPEHTAAEGWRIANVAVRWTKIS
jgi:hypothetical protein